MTNVPEGASTMTDVSKLGANPLDPGPLLGDDARLPAVDAPVRCSSHVSIT